MTLALTTLIVMVSPVIAGACYGLVVSWDRDKFLEGLRPRDNVKASPREELFTRGPFR